MVQKQKPLLPSMRDKKRYILFEVNAKKPISNPRTIADAIKRQALGFLGEYGIAQSNFKILSDVWNEKTQQGIVSVKPTHVDHARASLMLVTRAGDQTVSLRTIKTTGVINKLK